MFCLLMAAWTEMAAEYSELKGRRTRVIARGLLVLILEWLCHKGRLPVFVVKFLFCAKFMSFYCQNFECEGEEQFCGKKKSLRFNV